MASRRNQILAAVLATLGAVGKPAIIKLVARTRDVPVPQELHAAILIYPATDMVGERAVTPRAYKSLRVRVEMRHYGPIPDEALDPVYVWAVQRMMLDETFGGLAFACGEMQTVWDNEQADAHYGRAATDFEIRYFTNEKDPEQP